MNLDAAALERMARIREIIDDPTARWFLRDDAQFLRDWTVELARWLLEERRSNYTLRTPGMNDQDALWIQDVLTGKSSLRLGPRAYREPGTVAGRTSDG